MDESDATRIRDRYRLAVLENLCIYQAVSQPVFAKQMTADESLVTILSWLEAQPQIVSELIGARVKDAGVTALYEGEAREATDKMIKTATKVATELKSWA